MDEPDIQKLLLQAVAMRQGEASAQLALLKAVIFLLCRQDPQFAKTWRIASDMFASIHRDRFDADDPDLTLNAFEQCLGQSQADLDAVLRA